MRTHVRLQVCNGIFSERGQFCSSTSNSYTTSSRGGGNGNGGGGGGGNRSGEGGLGGDSKRTLGGSSIHASSVRYGKAGSVYEVFVGQFGMQPQSAPLPVPRFLGIRKCVASGPVQWLE